MNGKITSSGYFSTSDQLVSNIGGIVGYSSQNSEINSCYNVGTITGGNFVGGIVGWSAAEIKNCYYLEGTANYGGNNTNLIEGIEYESLNYMKSSNFLNDLNIDGETFIINVEKNNGYPTFKWQ